MVFNKQIGSIDAYFKKLNIRPARDGSQFVSLLYNKYEKKIVDDLVHLMVERPYKTLSTDYTDDVYSIKNQSYEFSLEFMNYNADLYYKYFEWFLRFQNQNPKRILDIGCENGFITCFYGLAFPKAKVIGIDPCENAIECAQTLAKKLKLNNVTFKKADVMEISNRYPVNHFDLITSVMTFKEIIGSFIQRVTGTPDEYTYWSIKELDMSIGSETAKQPLDLLENLLAESGRYISFERWFPEDTLWWAYKLKNSGLYINWEEAKILKFHEIGEKRLFPAMVIDKIPKEYDCIEKTLELWLGNDVVNTTRQPEYSNLSAEVIFNKTLNKNFYKGVQCNYSDSEIKVRYEFWTTETNVLCYQYSNVGFRELRIVPMESEDSLDKIIKDLMHYLSQYGYKIYQYNSVEERETVA